MSIFVFGSNLAGIHGAGAARDAHLNHGAVMGIGEGRTGNAYALPTKDWHIQSLSLREIAVHARRFILYANRNPTEQFFVTRIGCGLAGFKDADIAPLFRGVPFNCVMPIEWRVHLGDDASVRLEFHSWDDDQKNWPRPPSIDHMPDN